MVLLTACNTRKPIKLDGLPVVTGKISLDQCSFIYDFYNVNETEHVSEVFTETQTEARQERLKDTGLTCKVNVLDVYQGPSLPITKGETISEYLNSVISIKVSSSQMFFYKMYLL